VAQAAEGLDYAHGVGVIHRDVKPANLLVDGRGNVWVTDFGLAQFHADPGLTQSGDVLGTLRYMSPEQAGGQRVLIDHRTDVYSLGATLYELLTLRPIFDGADRQTLLRQILEDEPAPPRSVDRSVPPELETIVLKAVSKSPAERYATAREFADDLQRFLRDEPIRARRETAAQRARKWLRRHPSVPVTAAVLLGLLAVGSLVSAALVQRAYEGERRRNQQAEERFQLAQRAVDDMIELAEQEMADNPLLGSLRIRMLESALAYYQELIEQRGEDPDAQARLAATGARVQKILDDLTVLQGAGDLFLLNNDAVRQALGRSEDEKRRVEELRGRVDTNRKDLHGGIRGEMMADQRRQMFVRLGRANDAALQEILTPEQVRRFKQIALQAKGPWAFQDALVSAKLELNAAQKEQIRGILADIFFDGPPGMRGRGGRGGFGPGGPGFGGRGGPMEHKRGGGRMGGDRPNFHEQMKWEMQEMNARILDKMQDANTRILKLLTPEQKKRWQDMTGEPVEGLTTNCPPGPPPEPPPEPPPPFGPGGPPH
jgi:hypothetical protein